MQNRNVPRYAMIAGVVSESSDGQTFLLALEVEQLHAIGRGIVQHGPREILEIVLSSDQTEHLAQMLGYLTDQTSVPPEGLVEEGDA